MAERLGEAVLELSTDKGSFDSNVDSAREKTKKLSAAFLKAGAALSAIGVPFVAVAKSAIDAADNFAKMSAKVGISVETLSGLSFAAKLAGTDIKSVENGLGLLARNVNDASQGIGEAKESLARLGVSLKDSAGNLRSTDKILFDIADRFSGVQDGTEKTAIAMEILGRSGKDMIPLLNQGSAGLKEMLKEADSLGQVMSTETAQAAERFNDALTKLKAAFTGVINRLLESGFLDTLTSFAERTAEWVANFAQAHPTLTKVAGAVAAVSAVVGPLLIAFGLMLPAIKVIGGVLAAVFTFPAGVIAVAVAGITAFLATTEKGREIISSVWEHVKTSLENVWGAIKDSFSSIRNSLAAFWEEWKSVFHSVASFIGGVFMDILGGAFSNIASIISSVFGVISGLVSIFVGIFTGDWQRFSEGVARIWQSLWEGVVNIIFTGVEVIAKVIDRVAGTEMLSSLEGIKKSVLEWGGVVEQVTVETTTAEEATQSFGESLKNLIPGFGETGESANELAKGFGEAGDATEELAKRQKELEEQQKRMTQLANKQFDRSVRRLSDNIKAQAGEVNKLIKSTDSWGKSVAGLEKKLKEKLKTLDKLEKEAAKVAKATGQNAEGFQKWSSVTSALRQEIERLSEVLREGKDRMADLKERAEDLKRSIEADQKAFEAFNERIEDLRISSGGLAKEELKELQKQADAIKASIDEKTAALAEVQVEYENMARVVAASEGQLEQMNETLDEHKENLGDVGDAAKDMAKKHQEAIDETAREAERLNRVWEETMGNVVASISENLTDALFEAKNFADGMKQTFKEMAKGLVQLLIAELFSPLRDLMIGLGQSIRKWLLGGKGGFSLDNLAEGGGFSLAGLKGGGLLSGLGLIGTGAGLGASLGGVEGGLIGGGLGLAAAGSLGMLSSLGWFGAFAGPIGAAIAAVTGIVMGLKALFTNTPIEAGSKESSRDFGIGISEKDLQGFLPTVGLSEKQFKPIRKDILSSPKFLQELLIPAATAQGKIEELIARFSQFATSWGTFDLSAPLREAIESGNFETYNTAWEEVFSHSQALVSQFGPNFIEVLGGTEMALEGAGQAVTQYSDEIKKLAADAGVAEENLDIFAAAMESQKGIVAGLEDVWAGFSGTIIGFEKMLREETDLTTEQIQNLAWKEFGDQARELAAAYQELGLELPPLLQLILDFGQGLEQAETALEQVAISGSTLVSEIASISDLFTEFTLKNVESYGLQENAIGGLVEMIKEWAYQTDRISDVSEMTRADLNSLTQEFLNMARAAGIAASEIEEFAAGRIEGTRTSEEILGQAAALVGEFEGWMEDVMPRFADDIEVAQQLAWSEFGKRVQNVVSQLEAHRLDVPDLLGLVVDWGRQRGLLEGQNPMPDPMPDSMPNLSQSFGGSTPVSGGTTRAVSGGLSRVSSGDSSSLASLSASGLLPIQKAAEQLARGQAEQVVPLLRSINRGINPDEGVETRFLPRRTVVRREEFATVMKDIIILDEGGVREIIREI